MDFQDAQKVDRATWRRYLFYIDLVVLSIFAVALILLVRHSFQAGILFNEGALDKTTGKMWQLVSDTTFLIAALAWVVFRFFRNQYLVLTRRF